MRKEVKRFDGAVNYIIYARVYEKHLAVATVIKGIGQCDLATCTRGILDFKGAELRQPNKDQLDAGKRFGGYFDRRVENNYVIQGNEGQ